MSVKPYGQWKVRNKVPLPGSILAAETGQADTETNS